MSATDLEVGIRRVLTGVEVDEPGEVLLPAAQACNIVREATAKNIALATEDRTAVISYTGATYSIPCDDPADFPEMPGFDEAKAIVVGAAIRLGAWTRGLERVESRPARTSPRR
jgi:DNA polymerase-3 subunit beta